MGTIRPTIADPRANVPFVVGPKLPVAEPSNLSPVRIRNVLLLATAALVFALPMLIYGPMQHGYDTREHLAYARHFSEQFWAGEWYPRWLIGIHHGLGSPSLFVYPPLPTYVETLLEPVARLFHFPSFRIGEYLALLMSGICAALWLSTMASGSIYMAGALLYMLLPYHLALDYYRKTALAECWALAWMPLVLYFTARIIARRKAADVAGLGLAYALLILSHLVSVFVFSLIPLAGALALSDRGRKFAAAFRVAAGMMLGTGLSSFYFLSALANAKYFPVSRLPLWHLWQRYQMSMTVLTDASFDSFTRATYFSVIDMLALSAISAAAILVTRNAEARKIVFFWLAVCIIPTFLMMSVSSVVWARLPLLLAAVQFPFRFSIVLCVAATAVFVVFLKGFPAVPRNYRILSVVLLALALVPFFVSYAGVWRSYLRETEPPRRIVNEGDGWFYSWTPPGMDESAALRASAGPQLRFVAGGGTANLHLWKPRHIEFDTDSAGGGWIMANQFFYPAWRGLALDSNETLETKVVLPEGLLEVQIPPGHQRIRLEIPTTNTERVGTFISVLSAILSGVLFSSRLAG